MSVLLILCLAGVLVLAIAKANARWRQESLRAWQSAALELGLEFSGPEDERRMAGVLHGVPVSAEFRREVTGIGKHRRVDEKSTFSAGGDARIPVTLQLKKDTVLRSLGRFFDGEDEQLGDPEFDGVVELAKLDAYVCAALSSAARERLSQLLEWGAEVRERKVVHELYGSPSAEQAWLVEKLRDLAELAALLSVTRQELHERLAHNAVHDPSPGVRLLNLRFLTDESTRAPALLVRVTAGALLSDVSARVRLLAAQQLQAVGHPQLSELASNSGLKTELRVEALRALHAGGAPALDQLLAELARSGPPELACEALSVIRERQLSALSGAVVACTSSEHEAVRAAAATTLGRLPRGPSEAALIGLLLDPAEPVQRASAEALGSVGSVAAVEPLLPLAEGFGRAQLRQAARGAIGRIQSRLGNVEAGRLSLVAGEELAGAVDLAPAAPALRAGELSLAEPDPLSRRGRS